MAHENPPLNGKYPPHWVVPTAVVVTILAVLGSVMGSGGTPAGFGVAFLLNPIAWAGAFLWWLSTRITCPHCGTKNPRIESHARALPRQTCTSCRAEFSVVDIGNGSEVDSLGTPAEQNQTGIPSNSQLEPPEDPDASEAERKRAANEAERKRVPSTNYYEVLEVSPDAASDVIRAAYRSMNGKYHPDKDTSPDNIARFELIQEALEVLSDPERRGDYDATLGIDKDRERSEEPLSDFIVMRVDGSSSFLTLSGHFKRKGKELNGCDLSGLNISGISFRGANLRGAKLDGSTFRDCDFRDTDMTDCSAKGCNFNGTQFSGAQLVNTVMSGSSLRDTAFFRVGAIVSSTTKSDYDRFTGLDATLKTLDGTVQTKATLLSRADFSNCDLREAAFVAPPKHERTTTTKQTTLGVEREVPMYVRQEFGDCKISRCRFPKSNLHEVDFHGLDLSGCDFKGANLFGANFHGTDIQAAGLSGSNLINADLHKVMYCSLTKFPDGYPVPSDARDIDKECEAAEEQKQIEIALRKKNEGVFNASLLVLGLVLVVAICLLVAAKWQGSSRGNPLMGTPTVAATKGSFTVWTEPETPTAGKPDVIIVEVQLPKSLNDYRLSDLSGSVSGSDGYTQSIPYDSNHRNSSFYVDEESDVKRRITTGTETIKVRSNRIQLGIQVPRAKKSVCETIEIRSKLLDLGAIREFRFGG